jgi:hypothetical protein
MSAVLIAAFFVMLALSFPVAHTLVIGATLGVMTSDHFSLYGIIQQLFVPTQSFPLIAIPFFVMAAELMMNGTLGRNLIDFATDLVGRFRGGHAQVSVLGSTLFGGVSGSAVADATALGGMLIAGEGRQSACLLRCHHRGGVHHRHSYSAVDPADPLLARLERFDRRVVLRRHPARPAAGRRLLRSVQHQRAPARVPL